MKNKKITIEEKDLHTFSHDIKSLITSLYSYNQLLQRHLEKTGNTDCLQYTLRMQQQIQKLTKMVDEFISTWKESRGHLPFGSEPQGRRPGD